MKRTVIDRWTHVRRCVFLMLWCVLPIGLPMVSQAAGYSNADFPVTNWNKMQDNAMYRFSMTEQCWREADFDERIFSESEREVTKEDCFEIEQQREKICQKGFVPDGVIFPRLTGIINGKPGVYTNKQKNLGRIDQATICELSNGKRFAFFDIGLDVNGGQIEHCFNFGPFKTQSTPTIEIPKKVENCRTVNTTSVTDDRKTLLAPGYFGTTVCGSSVGGVMPAMTETGDRVVTEGQYEVCD